MDPRGRGNRGRSYGGRGSGGRHLVRWDAGGRGIGCPHDGPDRGPASKSVRGWAGAPPQGDRPGRGAFGGRGAGGDRDQRGGWLPSLAPGSLRTGRIAVQGRAPTGDRVAGDEEEGPPGGCSAAREGAGVSPWWPAPTLAALPGLVDSMASHLGRMESMDNMITYHYEESHVTTGAYRKKGAFTLKMSVINMNFLFLLVAIIFLGFLYTGSFPKLRMGVEVGMYDA